MCLFVLESHVKNDENLTFSFKQTVDVWTLGKQTMRIFAIVSTSARMTYFSEINRATFVNIRKKQS